MKSDKYTIVWSPGASEALLAIRNEKKRRRIAERVSLLAVGPGLHRPRRTATWGTVYLFTEHPFMVVYQYRGDTCEIVDVMDSIFLASYELKE